ncbi:MAG: hypothetical protein ABI175_21180 [Polyangiales bacterium]
MLLAAAPLSLFACASILGYGDLTERGLDGGVATDAPEDVVVVPDVPETLDASPINTVPPPRPTGAAVASGTGKKLWFEVKHFYLGSQNHAGANDKDGWREWGYDLDRVCTGLKESRENIGTCRRVDGANQDDLIDGDLCRDNNFGSKIIPLILLSNPSFEETTNGGILKGSGTWVFELEDVDDGPNDPYAPGKLYRAAALKDVTARLALDGSDVREVTRDSVVGGDVEKATVTFALGYIRDNVWVSGDPRAFDVLVPIGDFSATMPLSAGLVTMKLSDDHANATGGVAAGVLESDKFELLLRPVAERAGFCPGSMLYNSFLKTVSKFPDVYTGSPTLQDTTQTCDGISIGVGFDFAPIKPVTAIVDPPPIPPSKCADAGVDSG